MVDAEISGHDFVTGRLVRPLPLDDDRLALAQAVLRVEQRDAVVPRGREHRRVRTRVPRGADFGPELG